ncbi:DegV family EDD domain-containing protein [Aeromicrobium sp. 636]|uniref:DegV family protein n=1 Tax=Aeromicrobium senzhongii TaxID=2663859 RepID=A0A8I0EUK4_9ACTN|nr:MULTISPECIES: DegV family protein [Aeromicrobium]MBC9225658.1 DegV family protein [Aeromicrobium senzhongii]MCQ3997767.1 DegV family EDD domain-containing protein [Aeromicrobium sp. 636]MTB87694.1 DegV family EDD domain-containing protein [Aeromicrobium senzhongii]QNL95274.1 DegV family protein [Aeromicrobium senzhongii]
MTVAVVTDSTASLDADDAAREGISVVPTTVIIGARVYTEGVDVTSQMIADALTQNVPVSTSRPSPETFQAVYRALASTGVDAIVSVHISSKVSGTVDAARLAADRVDIPVHVVDTLQVGLATGFAAGQAARASAAGATVEEVAAAALESARSSRVLLYVDTLEYLRRGGRIGRAAALIGSALAVKPILTIDDGEVTPLEKVRTSSKALARLVALGVEAARSHPDGYDIGILHLASETVATSVAESLAQELDRPAIAIDEVGADIGAHVGPGMIAVTVSAR